MHGIRQSLYMLINNYLKVSKKTVMNMTLKKWGKGLCRQLRKGHECPADITNAQPH